jgi:ATP-dependent Clp protease ATP-binding subunit ClpC
MYEHFTEQARQALQHANQEAMRLGSQYIGCEHILLGILALRDSVAEACESLGAGAERIRQELEGFPAISAPRVPPAKKVIEFAMEESCTLNHQEIGTHHLLLGILRTPDNSAVVALERAGVDAELLRAEILRRFPPGDGPPVQPLHVFAKRYEHRPEVRALQRQIEELQRKLEEAVAARDFETAARYRDEGAEVRLQLRALLDRLQNDTTDGTVA